MADRKFEVPLHYDGPWLVAATVVPVVARDEADAVREALAVIGPPKVGQVREMP